MKIRFDHTDDDTWYCLVSEVALFDDEKLAAIVERDGDRYQVSRQATNGGTQWISQSHKSLKSAKNQARKWARDRISQASRNAVPALN